MTEVSYASNASGLREEPNFDPGLMDVEKQRRQEQKEEENSQKSGEEQINKQQQQLSNEEAASSSSRLEISTCTTDDQDNAPEAVVSPLGGRTTLGREKVITLGLLERTAVRKRDHNESIDKWIAKTTHLHVEGKGLTRLGVKILSKCVGLRYLYGYENKMEVLDKLPPKMEAIYLDDNKLEEIDLSHLFHLRVLCIRNNRLKNIDSLVRCPLEELHLARQPITPSIHVMHGLAGTLKILNMSECQIQSLDFMIPLINLEYLDISKNRIETVEDIIAALENFRSIQKLYVAGNPFCRQPKYRDSIVVSCAGPLLEIDDKLISNAEKEFLKVIVPRRKSSRRFSGNLGAKPESKENDVNRCLTIN